MTTILGPIVSRVLGSAIALQLLPGKRHGRGTRLQYWYAYEGPLGSINPARPSLKLNLHKFIETDDVYFEQAKRFTFNNQNQDASRMRTCMAYYIFASAGVPASLYNFAHIQINDQDLGVYSNVEPIKKPMLARIFGDDEGNLYEGTADIRAGGFMDRIEKKTNETEDDWSDIYRLRDYRGAR